MQNIPEEPHNKPVLDLNQFRNTRGSDPSLVPCCNCNTLINMNVIKCPHCGINFDGPAFQFAPDWKPSPPAFLWWRVAVWIAGFLALITGLILLFRFFFA